MRTSNVNGPQCGPYKAQRVSNELVFPFTLLIAPPSLPTEIPGPDWFGSGFARFDKPSASAGRARRDRYLIRSALSQTSQFGAKAKAIIWLFMTGSPSQVDTFDYKPELQKRDGQPLGGADPKTGFFTTSGKCLRSPFTWKQYGQTGSWVSEILPHTAQHVDDMAFIHSCYCTANNHAPAAFEINSGIMRPGRPSMGGVADIWAWHNQPESPGLCRHARDQAARRRRHLVDRLFAQDVPGPHIGRPQRQADRQRVPAARFE